MQIQKVFKAGNSEVVALPNEFKKRAGIKTGSDVVVDMSADGSTILISKKGISKTVSSVTPKFVEILERVNKRYGSALAELAKK